MVVMSRKVLVFTSLYPNNVWPNHGVFVKERMTHFASLENCDIRVVAPVPYFPPIKINSRYGYSQVVREEIREGIKIYHPRYFMTPKIGMSFYGYWMFLSVLPLIKKIKQEFDFDLIDAHYVFPDGLAGVLLGLYFKKPVIVSARGSDINQYVQLPLIRRLVRYTLQKSDRLIAVCNALKQEMIKLNIPAEKVAVIPNGVDHIRFHPISKQIARQELNLPNKKIIVSVGSLIPRKGFDLLINAVKILEQQYDEKDLYLVIVGEGAVRQKLEQMISKLHLEDKIKLVGNIPHSDLFRWYSAADLFCLTSHREGWPNVIMEAMACGVPVVATDVWGVPEIIHSEDMGFLTKTNASEIAKKISFSLKKSWDRDKIVQYSAQNDWHHVALSVLHEFNSILNGEKSQ